MTVLNYDNNRCPVDDCKHCFKPTERYLDWAWKPWKLLLRWHWHAPPPVTVIERDTTLLPDWIGEQARTYREQLPRALKGRR